MINRRQFFTSIITLSPTIQVTTLHAKSQTAIKATDFAVVADGIHDDSAALQAAIMAAQNKELYIAKGTY